MKKLPPLIGQNHISVRSIAEVNQICAPLFNNTPIEYFVYGKFYPDNSVVILDSYREWHEAVYIGGNYEHTLSYEKLALINDKCPKMTATRSCFIVDELPGNQVVTEMGKFGIASFLGIMDKTEELYEFYGFGSKTGKTIVSYYLNHLDVLNNFISYFKLQAKQLIEAGEKERIHIPYGKNLDAYERLVEYLQQIQVKLAPENSLELFLKSDSKNIPVIYKDGLVYLTAKQVECLRYLAQGLTAKQIAVILQVSSRTVEDHFNRIKEHFNFNFKTQLIELFWNSSLASLSTERSPH